MSDDLIKRSDAIKAVWGDDINPSEDGVVFEAQSHIDRDIRLIPSSDRPNATEIMNAYHEGVRKGIAEAYEAYGADRPQEWIPCSERLPTEEDQDDELGVLVTLGNGYSGLQYDWYHDGYWYDWNGFVVAWMPLPKPWKGADDE